MHAGCVGFFCFCFFFLLAFTCLGYECQDLLSMWDGMCAQTRPRLIRKSFCGMESEPMLIQGNPSTGRIILRGEWNPWHCIKQDTEPNKLPRSYSGPRNLVELAVVVCAVIQDHRRWRESVLCLVYVYHNMYLQPVSSLLSLNISLVEKSVIVSLDKLFTLSRGHLKMQLKKTEYCSAVWFPLMHESGFC